jgi:NADH-quinone oxidoreductase subunit G
MTDSGRALYKAVESEDRLTHYTIGGVHKRVDEAAAAAVDLLKEGEVAIIASARSSLEEQFYYKSIAEHTGANVSLVSHYGEGDGLLLSEDRRPNLRGALVTGLIDTLPEAELGPLARAINSGTVKTLLVVDEDVTTLGIAPELLDKVKIIYVGSLANETSKVADVVIPSLMVFEKEGSFINQSFRLQKFKAAVPGPSGILPDFMVLEKIAAPLCEEKPAAVTLDLLWQRIAAKVDLIDGAQTWRGIPEEGLALEPGALIDLPFVETKNLKYDPVAFKEAHAAPAGA